MIVDLLLALLIGLVLTAVIAVGYKKKGPWNNNFTFFLIIFLAAWAGGIWIVPFGPAILGVYWLPFVMAGIIITFVLLAAAPPQPPQSSEEAIEAAQEKVGVEKTITFLFWVLVIVLIIPVVLGYLFLRSPL